MSAFQDSREGKVIFDYDQLEIKGPTTFDNTVTYNSFVDNYTWPRLYDVGNGTAYIFAGGAATPIPIALTTVITDDFLTPPTLTHTGYFTINANGTITWVNPAAYYRIEARITGAFTTATNHFEVALVYTPNGGSPITLTDENHTVPAAAPFKTVFNLQSEGKAFAGDTWQLTIAGTAVTVTPEVKIWVIK